MHMTTVSGVENLFNDFRMFALFKEYMEGKKASEVVTAFVWLHKLKTLSPRSKRRSSREFVQTFIVDKAPRQLNIDYHRVGEISDENLTEEQVDALLQDITITITENWTQFALSPLLRRFQDGEYEPRLSQSEAKRFAFIRRNRRDSDDMLINHFKEQKVK